MKNQEFYLILHLHDVIETKLQNHVRIDANGQKLSQHIRELFAYRDLFVILAYRDLRERYAQTALGLVWGLFKPLFTIGIFVLVFSKGLEIETAGVPYVLFAVTGLIVWEYFAFVMSGAGASIIGAQNLVKKIYFPRLIIPLSKAVVGMVDFILVLCILIVLFIWHQQMPPGQVFLFPLLFVILFILAAGCGIWLSALSIKYRDFQHVIPFMVRIGLWLTPVAYPISVIPEKYHLVLYIINPLVGLIDLFRWCLLGLPIEEVYPLYSIVVIVILFLSSLVYFNRSQKQMADLV